jgi:hypothetical protein
MMFLNPEYIENANTDTTFSKQTDEKWVPIYSGWMTCSMQNVGEKDYKEVKHFQNAHLGCRNL